MKNNSIKSSEQYLKKNTSTSEKLIVPLSNILSSVIIACAVLFSAIIVSKNSLSKEDMQALLSSINTTAATTTAQATEEQTLTVTMDQVKSLFVDENVTFGDTSKKVLFVEFADPSCPYCHAAAGKNSELSNQMGTQFKLTADGGTYVAPVPEMKKLVDEGKAAYVWIYRNGHGNGIMGAQALYCADEKDKFWEVHDLLMSSKGYTLLNEQVKNDKANAGKLADFVSNVIDKKFMQSCLESEKYAEKLQKDEALATSLGITGTPGYFVNTTVYSGAYNFTDMKTVVEEALEK